MMIICLKLCLYHTKINKSKTDEPWTPGGLEKLLSQLNKVKQCFRQVKKSSDSAGLTNLGAEAL